MANGEFSLQSFIWKLALGAVGLIITIVGAVSIWALMTLIDVKDKVDTTAIAVSSIGNNVDKLSQSHWELVKRVDTQDKRMDGVEDKADAAFANQCAECAKQEAEHARNGKR